MDYREKFYKNYVSKNTALMYGEISIKDVENQFPAWKFYFSRFLPDGKSAKILDIGCGNGGFVYWLQQTGLKEAVGVDISREQVEEAKRFNIPNIQQGDLKDFLKNKNGIYDVIFMRDIIEHFNKNEIMEILELVNLALKEKGKIIIQTPNAESPFGGRYRCGDFTHEVCFTASSVNQVFSATKFLNIKVFPVRPAIHSLKSLIRHFLWRIIEIFLSVYVLIETGSAKGIFTQNLIAVAEK